MNITHFHDFSKTFGITFFSSTFPGLELTILKFHDFSRFFMTVRTLNNNHQQTVTLGMRGSEQNGFRGLQNKTGAHTLT